VLIREEAPQAVEALPLDPPCYGERGSITISGVEGGTPPYLYSIDGGVSFSSFPQFNNLPAGAYQVLVEDANGCLSPVLTLELQEPAELQILLEIQAQILLGDSYQINAQVSPLQAALDLISWTNSETLSCDDCLNPLAMPLYTTTYTLTVRDSNGCEASEDIRVYVDRRPVVYVPNAFSPNADGYNDLFMIFAKDESVREVKSFLVFDRWGEKVFEYFNFQPNDPAYGWDGSFRGQVMAPAVFVWFAEIEFITGEVVLFEGGVTLVR
jgi:gliding motility-associated-like protein